MTSSCCCCCCCDVVFVYPNFTYSELGCTWTELNMCFANTPHTLKHYLRLLIRSHSLMHLLSRDTHINIDIEEVKNLPQHNHIVRCLICNNNKTNINIYQKHKLNTSLAFYVLASIYQMWWSTAHIKYIGKYGNTTHHKQIMVLLW